MILLENCLLVLKILNLKAGPSEPSSRFIEFSRSSNVAELNSPRQFCVDIADFMQLNMMDTRDDVVQNEIKYYGVVVRSKTDYETRQMMHE